MDTQVWLLPASLIVLGILCAVPLSKYLTKIFEGKYRPFKIFALIEQRLGTENQAWPQYAAALIVFSGCLFLFGYAILALQPFMPMNPDAKTLLAPTTIFSSVAAFITNSDLQHYAGEFHLSNFSQIFFGLSNLFLSPAIGIGSLLAVIRALRNDPHVGNFFLDVWRSCVYVLLPLAIILGIFFTQQGMPMTFKSFYNAATIENGTTQKIVVGPVAAFAAIKMLGSNGGGFYNMNAAHPFENPTDIANFVNALAMLVLPMALVLTYGQMLKQRLHSFVLFGVMLLGMTGSIVWTIYTDTLQPNPAMTAHPTVAYSLQKMGDFAATIYAPHEVNLPVDQHLGNLEGKELRFGTSAGATYLGISTSVGCGSINAEPDSLNPLAAIPLLLGLWLNCFFGGVGVGMVNMLMYVFIGIFLAGMMVGRTPEYLGKKISGREVKLAIISLLFKPLLILLPLGLFVVEAWGFDAITNPGAHGFTQMLYQFSSASANNGSAFNGLNIIYGFFNNPAPDAQSVPWDIAIGLVILFSRYLPMIAPLALAAYFGAKTPTHGSMGTLHNDTATFAILLIGTLLIIGALLFVPVTALGPVAEHFGPIPFGG